MVLLVSITFKVSSIFELILFFRSNSFYLQRGSFFTVLSSPFHYKVFKKNIFLKNIYVLFSLNSYFFQKKVCPGFFSYSVSNILLSKKKYFFSI